MNDRGRLAQFHIAFDTNFAFVGAENKLMRPDLSELVLETGRIKHAQVSWYLLDIVRGERQYQMLQIAEGLISSAQKVGRLLGKDFGITKAALEQGINSVIADEVTQHALIHLKLDTGSVDWGALISRSLSRVPPFEAGKTEKGFRDAVVLETFCQLVQNLSSVKGHLRVILLTADKRLIEAARERTSGKEQVMIIDELNLVKTTLNAFAANIGDQQIESILEEARRLFYEADKDEALFRSWRIVESITADFKAILSERPQMPQSPNGSVAVEGVRVAATAFLGNSDGKLRFLTDINVGVRISDVVSVPTTRMESIYDNEFTLDPEFPIRESQSYRLRASRFGAFQPDRERNLFRIQKGRQVFEVEWEATLSPKGKLAEPVLIELRHHSTEWDSPTSAYLSS
jgi:hypothetical protein